MKAVLVVVVLAGVLGAPPCWAQSSAQAPPAQRSPPDPAPPTPVPDAGAAQVPAAAAAPAKAQPVEARNQKLLQWSVFDFQYLYGFNWQLGPKRKDVLTLEHADGWALGDNYLFVDVYHIANRDADTSLYGEWQPRFSLSKIIGKSLDAGPIHDVLQSNRLAFGSGFLAYLVGAAVDLNIPGFSYWHQHVFFRRDVHLDGYTWQITSEWAVPFEIGPLRFVQDGFVHFIGPERASHFNIITQPQLLLDLGHFGGYTDQLLVGVEVDLRYNEYGIDGQNEAVPQAMVEWKL